MTPGMIIVGFLLLVGFANFAAVALLVFVVLVARARRKPEASLVSPLVREKLNADLDAAITKRTVDQVKKDWLEADGWELNE